MTGGQWIHYSLSESDLASFPSRRAVDWLDDANWPTLLREMPGARLIHGDNGGKWWVQRYIRARSTYAWTDAMNTPEEAVCLSWIGWKNHDVEVSDAEV